MRLSQSLALTFFLFGALITGGLVARHVTQARAEAYARTRRLGAVTLEAVRSLVQAQARQGRFLELGRDLSGLVRLADVATVVVYDGRGRRLLARGDDAALLARLPPPGRGAPPDGIYLASTSVALGARGRGTLQVGFRTASLEERLRRIAAEGVQAGVTASLALALAGWLIGLFAGERIERVVARIEKLSAEPERFRPLSRGSGGDSEVSRLAAAFNRMGARLKAATEARRRLEEERRELTAMLVHDLKTPLTVIRSGVSLLGEIAPRGPDGRREHERTYELLELSTERLQRMVEDVLQLAKLEEASELKREEDVALDELARACAKDFALVAGGRRQTLALELPETPLAPVRGDGRLLRRVLDNLVHNAVEHTPPGGTITLSARAEGGGVLVEVSDSGPGVPPEARAEVFRKFFQKDVKRHVGNVGLGLALCEKVVTRHGGTIGVGDARPRGARFYFSIPAA